MPTGAAVCDAGRWGGEGLMAARETTSLRGQSPDHAAEALSAAESIGCRLVAACSRELLTRPLPPDALRQVNFV